MASYDKFDRRIDDLVVETKTEFADDLGNLSEEERKALAQAIHQHPELASQIRYERAHTGFTREITVTCGDVERLYEERFAAS